MISLEETAKIDNLRIDFDPSLKPNTSYYEKKPGCEQAVVYLPIKNWRKKPVYKDLVAIANAKHRFYKLSVPDIHIQETLNHPEVFANETFCLLKNASSFLIAHEEYEQADSTHKFKSASGVASHFGCSREMAMIRYSCGDGDILLHTSHA